MLDKTHLALCMKRLFTLSVKDSQHFDADLLRQDQRFEVGAQFGSASDCSFNHVDVSGFYSRI